MVTMIKKNGSGDMFVISPKWDGRNKEPWQLSFVEFVTDVIIAVTLDAFSCGMTLALSEYLVKFDIEWGHHPLRPIYMLIKLVGPTVTRSPISVFVLDFSFICFLCTIIITFFLFHMVWCSRILSKDQYFIF